MANRFDPKLIVPVGVGSDRTSAVVAGPHGTGKSTFLGSAAKVVGPEHTLLVATHSREVDSWLYKQLGIPHVLVEDTNWKPATRQYMADGYRRFLDTVEWLREEDDQYDVILVDSGTELGESAWHAALAPNAVGSPSEMDGQSRWLPYETLDNLLDQGIKGLVSLTKIAKRPKHVLVSWHVQPPKDDNFDPNTRTKKESADHASKGVEYEGDVLPMVRGRFRRRVGAQFASMLYTNIRYTPGTNGLRPEYRLQVLPNPERATKVPGPLPNVSYIPNDFGAFLALLRGEYVAEGNTVETPAASSLRGKLSRASR